MGQQQHPEALCFRFSKECPYIIFYERKNAINNTNIMPLIYISTPQPYSRSSPPQLYHPHLICPPPPPTIVQAVLSDRNDDLDESNMN
jgi:hypothetical protein